MADAYYSENDPYAAEWLRNLIKAGLIAPGDVDERSIADVRPDDIKSYTQCHFFAGIGVWSYALRLAGWPDDRPIWTGSCPCQPFSGAGKRGGFADERHLWPVWFNLIRERRPGICIGEQVASPDGYAWLDDVQARLEGLDHACGAVVTPAAGYGAPEERHRIYWMAHTNSVQSEQLARQRARSAETKGWRALGQFAGCGNAHGVADAYDARSQGRRERGDGSDKRAAGAGGVASRMADALPARRAEGRTGTGRGQTAGVRASGGLDHAAGARCDGAISEPESQARDETRLRVPGEAKRI